MNNVVNLTYTFYKVLENGQIKVTFCRFDGVKKVKVYKTTKGANYAVNSWQNKAMEAWEAAGRPDNKEVLKYRLSNFMEA